MKVEVQNGQLHLIAEEEFIFSHSEFIKAQMLDAIEANAPQPIVLDLSPISMVDSVGVKLVVGLYKTCQGKGLPLQVLVGNPAITRLFQICKLNQFLDIHEVDVGGNV